MSTKLIIAFIAAILAIASAYGQFSYGYVPGHYGFGGFPYAGYLGFRKLGYNEFPGFSKFGYGYGYPYGGVSTHNYSPYYHGQPVGEYGHPYFGKDVSYATPYKGYGYYGSPYVAVDSAAATSSSVVGY
ncbi:Hypothetical protein SRAE_2000079900 [Strongyloides ratti]|uniref:Uncharacterized protein n=1 Tax=Strongyloides ratti TaxID=34506 RepID=A0A090MXW2_STRRB|nr:Hypothetical protein SRAE_2000079900 [Strongyloides ratti]CEF66129.1 Hypothetical protein SRAE_2000079900 [Strongyloides ratti]